ncbi:hypothetical protein [Sphaerochaeta sp. PS]|uniref:hypothetical protein n=1 Tax=Sphaerochaeta sp. PS TaxID=3076336 RepID=UPI0028A51072|nr:hypothetical protein [Sphaerochaeta sp. PS]MDT4762972.1 hypothetical protein [Sphaerochaeta sp. PS]
MESESKKLTPANQAKRENNTRKRDRNRKKRGSKTKVAVEGPPKPKNTLLPSPEKKVYRSKLPPLPVRKIDEPLATCPICNEVIENIAEALTSPEGGFCHFDCVLAKIASDERISETQKVSYVGRGTFAVVEPTTEGGFSFVKKIVWETPETFDTMKKYVEATKK